MSEPGVQGSLTDSWYSVEPFVSHLLGIQKGEDLFNITFAHILSFFSNQDIQQTVDLNVNPAPNLLSGLGWSLKLFGSQAFHLQKGKCAWIPEKSFGEDGPDHQVWASGRQTDRPVALLAPIWVVWGN